jgi:Na+/proline symporter
MTLLAMLCAAAFDPKASLLSYVLSLMTFAYSGMLGVFLTALFTRRGNTTSVIAALLVGLAVSLLLHMRIMPLWTHALFHQEFALAWPWTMPAATIAAFLTCLAGRKPSPQ